MIEYNRIYAYTTLDVQDKEWEGPRKGRGLIKVGKPLELLKKELRHSYKVLPMHLEMFILFY